MDVITLSRLQFAITTIYHFLFVPVSLGLSIFIAIMQTMYLKTDNVVYKRLAKFFGKLFIISFAMGVVTGIVQEFHFGMNWSEYSRFMGDIFGAPLALEALTAFFLESVFLGVWIFGEGRLSKKLHCLSIWLVAFGSNLSAFWILVANSFMQHPVGYTIANGRAEMTDFFALVTNPYVVGQYAHTVLSGIVTAGVIVVAVSAYRLLSGQNVETFKTAIKSGIIYSLIGLFLVMGSVAMIGAMILAGFLFYTKRLENARWLLNILVLLLPLPFIANTFGWIITEAGRQPWMVVGLQKVSDAVSQNITSTEVLITLVGFTLIYALLAVAAIFIALKFVKKDAHKMDDEGGQA